MNLDRLAELDFDRLDRQFRIGIESGHTPFIGLQKNLFPPEIRNSICEELTNCANPLDEYMSCLSLWPAVFLAYITIYVAEGFGEHGTFEVYPFIKQALAGIDLTLNKKEKLWKAYRKHCNRLGLSVTSRTKGPHFMVDEYLRQAGVPLKYVHELTDKMMQYANIVGLPDNDDPSAIRFWQQGLCERLNAPFPKTVRKAVEVDDTCYYILLFLKLLEQPSTEPAGYDFETIMSQAIHNQGKNTKKTLPQRGRGIGIPQVVYRDHQLGVELPPGESNVWKITVDNDSASPFYGRQESRFVPFAQELPTEVLIEHTTGKLSRKLPLWEDRKNNRLLIFSSEGVLVAGTRLGAENSVTLEPGNYQLLLRFAPDKFTSEAEEISNDPALYTMQIFLDPEQQLSLSKGPASVSFVADSKPLFLWKGESVKSVRGYELFCSTGTHLKVIIPSELMAEEDVKYLICLYGGNIDESIQIPVEPSPEGHFGIDIANACRQWKPGVIRLLAELQRIGMQRPLIRSAIYLWNGLQQIKDKTIFCCDSLPSNINYEESDNLLINDEKKFLTFRNDDNRFFRITFNLNDNKRFVFTSVVPGMFMQLKDYKEAQPTEHPIKKGSTLSVGSNSRSDLEIFSTTNGTLCLGNFRKKIDFKVRSCNRLNLSSLIEYLSPMNNTLQFVDELTGSVEDLIRLVSPHEVLNFSVSYDKYTYKILFALVHEAAVVSIIATDLRSGRVETSEMNCNGNLVRLPSGINGWLTNEYDTEKECYAHELMISVDRWPCGAWILDFEASINNRWGGLSNAQGDRYSIGFIVTNDDVNKNSNQFIETARFLPPNERVAIIERVHAKLLYRYAIPSWNEIKWIKNILHALLSDFSENNKYAAKLISLSERNLPQDVSNGWVPRFSIAAYSPWLY